MKLSHIFKVILILLLPCFLLAQYPNNPVKSRLGWQTTGDGLVYRGSGAPAYSPGTMFNAWMYLDTTNYTLYMYKGFQWVKLPRANNGLTFSGQYVQLGGNLVRNTNIKTDGYIFQVKDTSTTQEFGMDYSTPSTGDTTAYWARRSGSIRQMMQMGTKYYYNSMRDTTGGLYSDFTHSWNAGDPFLQYQIFNPSAPTTGTAWFKIQKDNSFLNLSNDATNPYYSLGWAVTNSTATLGASESGSGDPGNGVVMGAYGFGTTEYLFMKTKTVDAGTATAGQYLQLINASSGEVDFSSIDLSSYAPISYVDSLYDTDNDRDSTNEIQTLFFNSGTGDLSISDGNNVSLLGILNGYTSGTGTAGRLPYWNTTTSFANSPIAYNSTTKRTTWDSPGVIELPMGTDAQRPSPATTSDFWYNTTSNGIEWYNGTRWAKGLESTANRFTTGSIIFANANGQATQDNAGLFWNDGANRLGIGTASPSTALTVVGAVTATSNGHRFGNFEILTSGNAGNTGAGVTVTGVDQVVDFQYGAQGMRYRNWANDQLTLTSFDRNVVVYQGGFKGNVNLPNLRGSVFRLEPTINFTSVSTNNKATGFYYNPTLTSLLTARHIAYENTTGDLVFGSISGSVYINDSIQNSAAILTMKSLNKGVLLPRMKATQRSAISSPLNSLLLYQFDGTRGFYAYDSITTAYKRLLWDGDDTNIYNSNGTSTADRTYNGGGFDLNFTSLDTLNVYYQQKREYINGNQIIRARGTTIRDYDVFGALNVQNRGDSASLIRMVRYAGIQSDWTIRNDGVQLVLSANGGLDDWFRFRDNGEFRFTSYIDALGDSVKFQKRIMISGFGTGNKEAADLSKTQSNYIAGFATDGTVLDLERRRDTTVYVVDADLDWSAAITTAQISRRYNRVIFLMTTTAAAGSDSDLTLHTPDVNLMQVEYLIRSTDEAGGFSNKIVFGSNNAVDSTNGLVTNYFPSAGQGVGIRAGLRSGVYKYYYY